MKSVILSNTAKESKSFSLVPDHKVQTEVLIQLSCSEFHEKYLSDDAEFGFDKFLD